MIITDVDKKIETLGDSFRGLWRSYEFIDIDNDEDFNDMWHVTFIFKGGCAETPPYDTIEEALDFAIQKVKK